ncbi:MAG: hypothetical protein JWO15_3886 [Sphingomonadales bacterium]|nr:hypothetical protein [Sphingomonadales bacterium]
MTADTITLPDGTTRPARRLGCIFAKPTPEVEREET